MMPVPPAVSKAVLAAITIIGTLSFMPLYAAVVKRARPPQFPQSVRDAFFPDAREKLVGPRPVRTAATASASQAQGPVSSDAATAQGSGWSKLISPETLEDEIKSTALGLAGSIQTGAQFKGGGYKAVRVQFSVLATMFGIVADYDGQVRWQQQAPAIRNLLARAGFNCKVGTDAAYKEATLRKEDLESLVGGAPVQLRPAEKETKWKAVTDRPPLMQRLEQAQQHGLAVWTSNSAEFQKNQEKSLHEAEVIAALAKVIQQEGFEYADDETYLESARELLSQAHAAAEAARKSNYDAARQATGKIEKACSKCHEGFRS